MSVFLARSDDEVNKKVEGTLRVAYSEVHMHLIERKPGPNEMNPYHGYTQAPVLQKFVSAIQKMI